MQAARCSTVALSCRRACLTATSTFQRAQFAQERTEIQKTFRALIHSSPVTYEVIHDKKHNAEKKDMNDVRKDLAEWEKRAGDAATRFPDWIERFDRKTFYKIASGLTVGAVGATYVFGIASFTTWAIILPVAAFWYQGIHDIRQPKHSIRRNFPVLGNVRYLFESIRPEIRQYFIESDHAANPFSRTDRSVVYQRAKRMADTLPFGTRHNVYEEGYEWINHSIWPKVVKPENKRIIIGGPHCKQPYSASIFNISAMSHGSLSNNAIEALNTGAKYGGFYHNTGEGGISRFHLKPGGDIVWNVGTGYFGCRSKDGSFNEEMFVKNATRPQVKMIELKISQGAKPAHGGLLPKSKISKDIMEARGLTDATEDCLSPSSHSAFTGARGMIQFVQRLRDLSGGKPIGWKMCVGRPEEFVAICLAMLELDITPDFITIDGAEGGTGAAPNEYSNRVGTPLVEGLTLVDAILTGCGLRNRIKLISAGKIITGFHLVKHLALGADICNSARGMMFALGCIQALKCNTNRCPSGVATQDPDLMAGLDIGNKSVRVYNFQKQTVETACELIGAVGLEHPDELQPEHIIKRISQHKVMSYDKLYPQATHNCLLDGTAPALMTKWWEAGKALYETQRHQSPDEIRTLHQNISESR